MTLQRAGSSRGRSRAVAALAAMIGARRGCSTIEWSYNSTFGRLFGYSKPKAKPLEP